MKKKEVDTALFRSRSSGKTYTVKSWDDGSLSCDCPGWRFKRGETRTCRHVQQFNGETTVVKPTTVYRPVVDVPVVPAERVSVRVFEID